MSKAIERSPESIIDDARMRGRVIECTAPDGGVTAFLPIPDVNPGWFVSVSWNRHTGLSDGHVVDPAYESTIHNQIRLCSPEVRTVREKDSLFEKVTE